MQLQFRVWVLNYVFLFQLLHFWFRGFNFFKLRLSVLTAAVVEVLPILPWVVVIVGVIVVGAWQAGMVTPPVPGLVLVPAVFPMIVFGVTIVVCRKK